MDADKPREIGEIYDVKLPNKQADIIVTVEITEVWNISSLIFIIISVTILIDVISIINVLQSTEKIYKDIIVPLVGQVIDQLKSKRITDVKVYLVGISSKYPYPILYDTDCK